MAVCVCLFEKQGSILLAFRGSSFKINAIADVPEELIYFSGPAGIKYSPFVEAISVASN